MQIVFQKAQTKRTVELLLLLVSCGDLNYPNQGGIQSGARVNTLLSSLGSTQGVTDWGGFRSPCRRVGGLQFGSQQASAVQKNILGKVL